MLTVITVRKCDYRRKFYRAARRDVEREATPRNADGPAYEAGARVVTRSYGRWDSHGKNFDLMRDHGKKLDQCLSALIEDLDARGLLDDVTVIAWGEFGRTPRAS